jgi:hypothetical protein
VVTAVEIPPTTKRGRCRDIVIPPAAELTYGQGRGWDCVACGKRLPAVGAVLVGRAKGESGAHDISADVWACP